ncbi:MAG: hypothetical protein AB7F65_09600 [Dehalococcoidia bacterium]
MPSIPGERSGPGEAVARESLPRTLVVGGPPFNPNVGAGVTLTGLFGGWPRDALADAYEGLDPPDSPICDRFHPLSRTDALPSNKWLRQLSLVRQVLNRDADANVLFGRVGRRLDRFVSDFAPEAMFMELSSLSSIDIVLELARRYRIPFAVHVPDDWTPTWPRYAYRAPWMRPAVEVLNRRLQYRVPALMREASVHLAISDSLAGALSARHGRPFGVAYNAVDPTDWPDRPPREVPAGDAVRIVYSGSVFSYGQSQSLADTAEAVRRLAARGIPVRLDVYTQHHADLEVRALLRPGAHVALLPLVPREALGDNLRAADVLLLPVNFDETTLRFIRYSMPGKMAEYLMAGRALLAYGPPEVEQIRFARDHECAFIVDRPSSAALEEAIAALVGDPPLRADLGARARATGLEVFDLRRVRADFERRMVQMVRAGA